MEINSEHTGAVVSVDGETAEVKIDLACGESCGGCHLSGICNPRNTCTLKVLLGTSGATVGNRVAISSGSGEPRRAVWLLVCLPLAVFLASVVVASAAGLSDLLSGIIAFAAAAFTYLVIHIVSKRNKPVWRIVKVVS